MKAYPNYKDSGVPWLEHVPEHWEVLRLGSQFVERKQKVSDKDFAPLSVTKKGILPQLDTAAKSNDGDNRKKVCSGDFVINSRSDRKGSSGVSPHTGSVSLINTVLTPISLDGRYVHNFFRSHSFQEEFYRVGCGIVADLWSTKYADMRTIMIPVPSPDEQQKISRYLDWQTSKINRFIKAKKKLIYLLKEQKQNVINEAVTKGINPNVEMKDSGVEWLGEIPAHWDVLPLRWHLKIASGEFRAGDLIRTERSKEYAYPVIGGNGVMGYTNSPNSNINTIVIGRVGALCGNVHLTEESSWITDNALRLSNIRRFRKDYFALQLRTMNLNKLSKANAQPLITGGVVKAQKAACPPEDEQQEIVIHIEKETALIDKTIARTEREIELIQEYRTRLVSDVVTGKVDIRSVEIPDFEPVEADLEVQDDEESEDELITEDTEE
jgi:type I restriction enzyme S subunit